MSWDAALEKKKPERKAQPAPKVNVDINLGSNGKNFSHAQKYVLATFESACRAVADAPEGVRNDVLNSQVYATAGFVHTGFVTEDEITSAFEDAARWGAPRCKDGDAKKIAEAIKAGMAEPREIPEPKFTKANGSKQLCESHSSESPHDDFGPVEYDEIGEPVEQVAHSHLNGDEPPKDGAASVAAGVTVPVDVLARWRADGRLVHEPTGIAGLDELTGGGPVYGTRWYLAGAPDAGKTALLVQIAHTYALRGIAVGLLAVDEEADDLVTRLAQRCGWERSHCEIRDPGVLESMREHMDLPIRIYDGSWTIESAAEDLARHRGERRAMFGIDSLQTVTCSAELAAERQMAEVQAVTARTRAIRSVATRHRMITITTSELGRGAYASNDPKQQTSILSSAKWSGAVEYSARVLLGLRSVAGEKDVVDVEVAKNKHGPRDEHVYLRIDRRSQTLSASGYEPPPAEDQETVRDEKKRARVAADAETVLSLVIERPGMGVRDLIGAAVAHGLSKDRVYAALSSLGDRVERRPGKRDAIHHYARSE